MEYERQQREYRQQQEQQRLEQQRQQQLMNENARRQQEESRQLNAPVGQGAAPGYQGGIPQQQGVPASRRAAAQSDATAATAGATWVNSCSNSGKAMNIYVAKSTIQRSDNLIRMWDMMDFKTVQEAGGVRFLSAKTHHEFDCKGRRMRMLSTTGFSGQMGKGSVVAFDNSQFPWESLAPGDLADVCFLKAACEQK
jgi:hypothetical protein